MTTMVTLIWMTVTVPKQIVLTELTTILMASLIVMIRIAKSFGRIAYIYCRCLQLNLSLIVKVR
jgi:hypothetical protein